MMEFTGADFDGKYLVLREPGTPYVHFVASKSWVTDNKDGISLDINGKCIFVSRGGFRRLLAKLLEFDSMLDEHGYYGPPDDDINW